MFRNPGFLRQSSPSPPRPAERDLAAVAFWPGHITGNNAAPASPAQFVTEPRRTSQITPTEDASATYNPSRKQPHPSAIKISGIQRHGKIIAASTKNPTNGSTFAYRTFTHTFDSGRKPCAAASPNIAIIVTPSAPIIITWATVIASIPRDSNVSPPPTVIKHRQPAPVDSPGFLGRISLSSA